MLYYWVDILWLPLGLFVVQKHQRVLMAAFVISSMVMMRLLVELVVSTGYESGFLPLMTSHAYDRALAVYSVFYMLFFIIAHYSPRTDGHVFIAASITTFFACAVTAILVMLL